MRIGDQLDRIPLHETPTGRVFYVADGDTAGSTPAMYNQKPASDDNSGSYLDPFKTLDYAIEQCSADRDDVIYLMPGYKEAISTAGGIALDVDGVAIRALGTGSEQPTISVSGATSSVAITANNVLIDGVRFQVTGTAVLNPVDIEGGDGTDAEHVKITNCVFEPADIEADGLASSLGAFIKADEVDYLTLSHNVSRHGNVTTPVTTLHVEGLTFHNHHVYENEFSGSGFTTGILDWTGEGSEGNTSAGRYVHDNVLIRQGDGNHGTANQGNGLQTGSTARAVTWNNHSGGFWAANSVASITGSTGYHGGTNYTGGRDCTYAMDISSTGETVMVPEITVVDSLEDEHVAIFTIDGAVLLESLLFYGTTNGDTTQSLTLATESGETIITATEIHTMQAGGMVRHTAPGSNAVVVNTSSVEGTYSYGNEYNCNMVLEGAEAVLDITQEAGGGVMTVVAVWRPLTTTSELVSSKA